MKSFIVLLTIFLLYHLCQGALQCNQLSRSKRNVLEHPGQLPNRCQYTIEAYSQNVCQLLIQFERFELKQPTLMNTELKCSDRLLVGDFVLCGSNNLQHLYVEFPRTARRQIILTFDLPERWSQTRWRLTVTQLECPYSSNNFRFNEFNSGLGLFQNLQDTTMNLLNLRSYNDFDLLAPIGCHQYYSATKGTIKSFNFNDSQTSLYLPNLNYVICVKARSGSNLIEYHAPKFSMSIAMSHLQGYDEDCRSIIHTPGRREDSLMIPQASFPNLPSIKPTYFCGRSLQGRQVLASSPFMIYFSSDGTTDPTETGFKIDYSVI